VQEGKPVCNTPPFSRSRTKSRFIGSLALTLFTVPFLTISLWSQTNCPLPPAIQPIPHELNIFSDEQEVDLGDAMAESFARHIRIIDDDKLSAYLRTLGDRLVQHLPPNQMKFRFYLVELPEVNAFSIAGGRVYVARKMVAFAKSDDELAGVLAHELGHIVTHQQAIEMTARLREGLGVTQLGDRADVFEKFHKVLENARRMRRRDDKEEAQQYVADQVALYAMARAGYAPHAFVDFWDRFQQTHGKTGSWLSDLFGTTKPSERRLGVMLKNLSALPTGCADIPAGSRTAAFANWQADVVGYSGLGTKESLPGLVFKQTLARPLRPDITNLRYSSDGKYILAQDEGGIHVLTREPFAVLFYIPAIGVYPAHFTPDSRSIVFHNSALRVESWSVAEQRRTSAHELAVLHGCFQSELSPDGLTLGCLNSEFDLSLINVQSGSILTSKKDFTRMTRIAACNYAASLASGGQARLIAMNFSPDGRYFLAGAYMTHFAWDLSGNREFQLPGSIKSVLQVSFAFVGPDRIVGISADSPLKSPVLRFPSGERQQQIQLAIGLELSPATHGDYFFVGPLKNDAMGLVDLKTATMPIKFKHPAADVYDGTMVTERVTGELALHALDKLSSESAPLAVAKLPQGRLAPLRAAAVSPDFNWIAISHRTRGGVWDVTHNVRTVESTNFDGAWFAPDQSVYVDFAKFMETDRAIARIDPASGHGTSGYKIGDAIADQLGPYLALQKPRTTSKRDETAHFWVGDFCYQLLLQRLLGSRRSARDEDVEIRDVRDGHLVWSRYFPHEVPGFSVGWQTVLLRWPLNNATGRDELAKYPELKNNVAETDYLLEKIDLRNDSVIGKLVIKTNKGSFAVEHVYGEGDWIIVQAGDNQVITYSLSTGEEKGHFFGDYPELSGNGLMALENEAGELSVYDLASSQPKQEYIFTDPVSLKRFSPDGKRLFVMTASQTAYILDLDAKN
jgi:WD40 repeat protein